MKTFASILFLCAILLFFWWGRIFKEIETNEAQAKKPIGTKVILEKDTLLVIDYSTLKQTYTLSNGKEINFELINKLQKIK